MDSRSKPTFVPRRHHLLFVFLLVHLLVCLLSFLFLCLPCLSCSYALYLFHMLFASFPSVAFLLVSCLCPCMQTYGVRTLGARAWSPRRKQKGRECKYVNMSRAAMFSWFRGLASPIGLCTLLKPPSFPPPPPKLRANHVDHSRGASNGPCGHGSPFQSERQQGEWVQIGRSASCCNYIYIYIIVYLFLLMSINIFWFQYHMPPLLQSLSSHMSTFSFSTISFCGLSKT